MKACNFQTEANIDHLIFVQSLRTQSSKIQNNSMESESENDSLGFLNPRFATACFLRSVEPRRQQWRAKNEKVY